MKSFKKLLMAGFLFTNLVSHAEEPYESIRSMPATPYYVQDAYTYFDLISTRNYKVVIDVESEDAGVARFIAQQASNLPSLEKIYSVNAWLDCGANKHRFQRFLSNVSQENSSSLIIPLRMSSKEAALALNVTADLINIVGGNDMESVYQDIVAWFPHLNNNGIICGNNWADSAVEIGVTRAAAALGQSFKINNNIWYFERNGS